MMKMLRVAPLLCLVGVFTSGCRPEASSSRQQARSALLPASNEPSCKASCAQASRCGLQVDASHCQSQCEQDKAHSMRRCAMLQECGAYLACQAKAQPPHRESPQALAKSCAAQCQALGQCQATRRCEAQRFAALAVPGCEGKARPEDQSACEQACNQSARPCAAQSTCEALEACAESQRQYAPGTLLAASEPHAAMNADPNCHALCDRALRCGIEASGASAQEQDRLAHSLPASLLDSQTECLMQCQADYRSERRAEFEACLGQNSCSDFIDCANEL